MYKTIQVNEKNKKDFIDFLENYQETSLFLLGNLDQYGCALTDHMNSGNFRFINKNEKIAAAFCLTKRGNLLIQTDNEEDYSEIIFNSCMNEDITIEGIIGDWASSEYFLNLYCSRIKTFRKTNILKEKLYLLELKDFNIKVKPDEIEKIRFLNTSDFTSWDGLNKSFLTELELNVQGSVEERKLDFTEKVNSKYWWGLFIENNLTSKCQLTARYKNIGQVGGVYTLPEMRRKGYSNKCMIQFINDCKTVHNLDKLILFTDRKNRAAQNLYESLGFKMIGEYALLFGTHTE